MNPKPTTLIVAWGEEAAGAIMDERWADVDPGCIRQYDFDTPAEREAFLYGVNEAQGIYDFNVLTEDEEQIIHQAQI